MTKRHLRYPEYLKINAAPTKSPRRGSTEAPVETPKPCLRGPLSGRTFALRPKDMPRLLATPLSLLFLFFGSLFLLNFLNLGPTILFYIVLQPSTKKNDDGETPAERAGLDFETS